MASREFVDPDEGVDTMAVEECSRFRLKGFRNPRMNTLYSRDSGGNGMFLVGGKAVYFSPSRSLYIFYCDNSGRWMIGQRKDMEVTERPRS